MAQTEELVADSASGNYPWLNSDWFDRTKEEFIDITFGSVTVCMIEMKEEGRWKKVVVRELGDTYSPMQMEEMKKEFQLLFSLENENLVKLLGVTDFGCGRALVMEKASRSLKTVIDNREEHSLLKKLRWMRQAAAGIEYLHDKRLIHKVLKPTKLLLFPSPNQDSVEEVVRVSFGFHKGTWTMDSHFDNQKVYLSPERLNYGNKHNGCRLDVFSFAFIFWHLLTYQHPLGEEKTMKQLEILATDWENSRPKISLYQDEFPKELLDLIERCWNGKYLQRPLMGEVRQQLDEIIKTLERKNQNDQMEDVVLKINGCDLLADGEAEKRIRVE